MLWGWLVALIITTRPSMADPDPHTSAHPVIHAHHDENRDLIRAGVAEVDALVAPLPQAQQTRGLTQFGELLVKFTI